MVKRGAVVFGADGSRAEEEALVTTVFYKCLSRVVAPASSLKIGACMAKTLSSSLNHICS